MRTIFSFFQALLSGASLASAALSQVGVSARDGTTPNATDTSTFVSPQGNFGFAMNVPDNSSTDLYFSLAFSAGLTWAAVGLGASNMKQNALVLMVYPSASGKNVTISPRRTTGHTEPAYDPDINVQTLSGTGLVDNSTFLYNGVCTNCRSWTSVGGSAESIDVTRTAQAMIYGVGPEGNVWSDNPRESINVHYSYGSFTMDLVSATGPGGIPVISESENATSAGAVLDSSKTGHTDVTAKLHAAIMVFIFFGVWPFGVMVLRLFSSPKWHAINQIVAVLLMTLGAILGFVISTSYTRSKSFNTAHQILGIIIFIAGLTQFLLGFFHHRTFKKTQQTTKLAPIHVWLGRLVIILGVANAFTGFPLALAPRYDFALLALVLTIFPAIGFLLLVKKIWKKLSKVAKNDGSNGYKMEPWRGDQSGEQGVGAPQGLTPHYHGGGPEMPTQMYQPQMAREYV
ncbi:iron reductase domain protein [Xylariaceae sp. FL0255]|nr:iron reductase domain protein [Xylariaceae sp. FL0255]